MVKQGDIIKVNFNPQAGHEQAGYRPALVVSNDFYNQKTTLAGADPHPRLLLEGRGIHAGEGFTALFPDGWHDITLEVRWDPTGLGYWYISTPGFKDVCPVGLFVKCK